MRCSVSLPLFHLQILLFFVARGFGFLFFSHIVCVDTFLYLLYNLILNHSYLSDHTQHHVCPHFIFLFSLLSYHNAFANLRALCFVPTSLDHGSGLEGYPKTT